MGNLDWKGGIVMNNCVVFTIANDDSRYEQIMHDIEFSPLLYWGNGFFRVRGRKVYIVSYLQDDDTTQLRNLVDYLNKAYWLGIEMED